MTRVVHGFLDLRTVALAMELIRQHLLGADDVPQLATSLRLAAALPPPLAPPTFISADGPLHQLAERLGLFTESPHADASPPGLG